VKAPVRSVDPPGEADRSGGRCESGRVGPPLAALLVLAVGFRLPVLFLSRYGGTAPDWSDFRYYHELASLSAQGFLPAIHFWVEYPPLFPWLAVVLYRVSLLVPPWIHPLFWFDLLVTLVLATADVGTIVLIDYLGDAFWGPPLGRRSAVLYAAFFLPAYAVLGWFDALPTFFLLLALALLLVGARGAGRTWRLGLNAAAGLAAGIGIMVKLFPAVAVVAVSVLARTPSTSRPPSEKRLINSPFALAGAAAGAMIISVGIISLPFLILGRTMFLATIENILARGSWLSLWALLDGYYDPGGVAAISDRLFYPASASWGHPARSPALWWAALALGGGFFLWRWWVARRIGTPRAAIGVTALAVALILLLSKGFSEQFLVWLLPFVAILLPSVDGAVLATLLWLDSVVLEGYLYITLFPTVHALLWISVAIRTALLLWFAIEAAFTLCPSTAVQLDRWRRWLVRPAVGLITLAALIALIETAPRLEAAMLDRTGDAPVAEALRLTDPNAVIVFTQTTVLDRLAALAQPRTTVLLAEPHLLSWTGDRSLYHRLDNAVRDHSSIVVVSDTRAPASPVLPAVRSWLSARYGPPVERTAGSVQLETYSPARAPSEQVINATFGRSMALAGFRIVPTRGPDERSERLTVILHWRAHATIDRDYTVSLQLLSGAGRLVAQHDAMPVDNTMPTTTWEPGQEVWDAVPLDLPRGLPTGSYRLTVVVYDHQTLHRLSVSGPGQHGDTALLAVLHLPGP
jgi:hypothetical protein